MYVHNAGVFTKRSVCVLVCVCTCGWGGGVGSPCLFQNLATLFLLCISFIGTFTVVHDVVPCWVSADILQVTHAGLNLRPSPPQSGQHTLSPYPCPIFGSSPLLMPWNPYVIFLLVVCMMKSSCSYAPGKRACPLRSNLWWLADLTRALSRKR